MEDIMLGHYRDGCRPSNNVRALVYLSESRSLVLGTRGSALTHC